MLDWLLHRLAGAGPSLGWRMALAGETAFLLSAASGGRLIAWLRRMGLTERTDKTPIEDAFLRERIAQKSGTPTMGAVIVLTGLVGSCVLWSNLGSPALHALLLCMVALAGLGMTDDLLKLRGKGHTDRGVRARWKLIVQAAVGGTAGALLWLHGGGIGLPSLLQAAPGWQRTAGLAAVLWAALVVTIMSNSANVSDGMDGLIGGLTALAAGVLAVACWAATRGIALPVQLPAPEAAEAGVFCSALMGGSMGFLIYNRHPAQVFMGDTGSLPVGGCLGLAAIVGGVELLLPVVAFVLLAELASSLAQIFAFKLTGQRVLPVAPLHHIFEQRGWSEPKIVTGFYLVGAFVALSGLILMAV